MYPSFKLQDISKGEGEVKVEKNRNPRSIVKFNKGFDREGRPSMFHTRVEALILGALIYNMVRKNKVRSEKSGAHHLHPLALKGGAGIKKRGTGTLPSYD